MSSLIKFKELQSITGYERPSDVESALINQGIKVFRGKSKTVWTTIELINAAGGIVRNESQRDIKIKK